MSAANVVKGNTALRNIEIEVQPYCRCMLLGITWHQTVFKDETLGWANDEYTILSATDVRKLKRRHDERKNGEKRYEV